MTRHGDAAPIIEVRTTVDDRQIARRIADGLLRQRLAACVQLEGPLESRYHWQGALEVTEEWKLTIKTTARLLEQLQAALSELHPYEEPELLAFSVVGGSDSYCQWVRDETRSER